MSVNFILPKTGVNGLPGSEGGIIQRSFRPILTQDGHVTDGRTDRRTDGQKCCS